MCRGLKFWMRRKPIETNDNPEIFKEYRKRNVNENKRSEETEVESCDQSYCLSECQHTLHD